MATTNKLPRENHISLQLRFPDQYSEINQQMGKLDAIHARLLRTDGVDEQIKLARSMRGHVAVMLKQLHDIRRKL